MLIRALIPAVAALAFAAGPASAAVDELRDEQWGLKMVKGPDAWSTSTGVGAVIAVIDTGVQLNHPDLGDRLLPGYDYVGNDPIARGDDDEDPKDGNGHGTHVTGIAVANRDNTEGIAGIAPGAKVLPIRVLDNDGEGYADDTIEAIDYAIEKGAHVINLSLGDFVPLQSTVFPDAAYRQALERALAAGIVVVLAAGNNGFVKCENPDVEDVLCVGAVDSRGQKSAFSSFGQDVDLMAPGGSGAGGSAEDVLSTYTGSEYASVAGTSQAAPHVAGVAALLVSLGVRGKQAMDRIVGTAAPAGPSLEYGAGIVDAAAAVAGLGTPPPPDPGDPTPPPPAATGSFSTAKSVRARTVRRRGFRVACKAARPGRCLVKAYYRGRKIAAGRADVPAEIATTVAARLNPRGKRLLKGLRRRIRVRVTVRLPGEATRARKITVRR